LFYTNIIQKLIRLEIIIEDDVSNPKSFQKTIDKITSDFKDRVFYDEKKKRRFL